MLEPDCTVGLTISGALTPAGLGMSCLIPLVGAGFVDWIVSTGANLYHDTHYALDLPLHQSQPNLNDYQLREHDIIRIYDIVFDYTTLLDTDAFYRELIAGEPSPARCARPSSTSRSANICTAGRRSWAAPRTACSPPATRRACPSTPPAPATARSA